MSWIFVQHFGISLLIGRPGMENLVKSNGMCDVVRYFGKCVRDFAEITIRRLETLTSGVFGGCDICVGSDMFHRQDL